MSERRPLHLHISETLVPPSQPDHPVKPIRVRASSAASALTQVLVSEQLAKGGEVFFPSLDLKISQDSTPDDNIK